MPLRFLCISVVYVARKPLKYPLFFCRLFGNGFHAWTTFEPYCKHIPSSYTDECFANNIPSGNVEEITKKTIPTFVPFTTVKKTTTTTKTTITPKPKTVQSTLTSLNQFKYLTFVPQSLHTPTRPTTKYPTAQFTNNYRKFTTTKPSIGSVQPFSPKSTTKLAFSPQSTTPRSTPQIRTKTTDKHSYAVIRNSYFSSTTPRPLSTTQKLSSSTKVNLFDLYLNRFTTKKPERYVIPTFATHSRQSVTHSSPYVVSRTTTTTKTAPTSSKLNAYAYKIKSTTNKPSQDEVQYLFKSKVSKLTQTLGISHSTHTPINADSTTPKPHVWRYSFSGTKAPASQ